MFLFELIFTEGQPKGFSFQTLDQMYAKNYRSVDAERYASQFFKPDTFMGQGSSRLVYRLDSKKVLKLAHDQKHDIGAGIEQNKLEARISSQFPDILSRVFRIHPKGYYMVSELVRPVTSWDEVTKYFGVDITDVIPGKNLPEIINIKINDIIQDAVKEKQILYFDRGPLQTEIHEFVANKTYLTYSLQDWLYLRKQKLHLSPLGKLQFQLNNLMHFSRTGKPRGLDTLVKTSQGQQLEKILTVLSYGDLLELGHWGKTADGKIVLLDYGFNEDIAKQYY